jgi:hypothetical protein
MSKIKIAIVGAGSAGLFAANEIGKQLGKEVEIKIFDAGPPIEKRICPQKEEFECAQCDPCRIMSGIGGAGVWSSGILNFNKKIGGDLEKLCSAIDLEVEQVIQQIDYLFLENGAPDKIFDPYRNKEELKDLRRKCAAVDVRFVPIRQRLLGSKNTPKIIKSIQNSLETKYDIKFFPNTKVLAFDKDKNLYFANNKKE